MPSACFIDTNILLYAQDPNAPEKRKKAAEWLKALVPTGLVVISPQVMNEFAYNVLKKFRHVQFEQLRRSLEDMGQWCRAPMTSQTSIQALLIHERFKFSFFDACIVASALSAGCGNLLSEDLSHNQRVHRLRIINPFVTDLQRFLQEN